MMGYQVFFIIVMALNSIYGVAAMITILVRRALIRQKIATNNIPPIDTNTLQKYGQGKAWTQVTSHVIHVILLITAIAYIIYALLAVTLYPLRGNQSGYDNPIYLFLAMFSGLFMLAGFLLVLVGPFTAIVNGLWVYPTKNIFAEELSLRTGSAPKTVKNKRHLGWVVWIIYTIFATALAFGLDPFLTNYDPFNLNPGLFY